MSWRDRAKGPSLAALATLAALSCSRHERPQPPPISAPSTGPDAAALPLAAATATDGGASAALPWDESIRRAEWASA